MYQHYQKISHLSTSRLARILRGFNADVSFCIWNIEISRTALVFASKCQRCKWADVRKWIQSNKPTHLFAFILKPLKRARNNYTKQKNSLGRGAAHSYATIRSTCWDPGRCNCCLITCGQVMQSNWEHIGTCCWITHTGVQLYSKLGEWYGCKSSLYMRIYLKFMFYGKRLQGLFY